MTQRQKIRDRLQQQYRLRVLRIYLDNSMSEKSIAIFSLTMEDGEEVALLTASMNELGLPASTASCAEADAAMREAVFRIPAHILGALTSILRSSGRREAPLWLRLSVPVGLLPAVPWERLLQPSLGIPILRLPHQRISPRAPTTDIDTVICFSSPVYEPDFENRLELFMEQMPADLVAVTDFHFFAGNALYPALMALKQKYSDISIAVYPPPDEHMQVLPDTPNVWLSWIRSSLGERSADVVHFLCHGYHASGEGALAMAASPAHQSGDGMANLVATAELIEFLNQVGAWCVVFTSTQSDGAAAGMRMLQNAVARLRPGPAIMHDMKDPDSRRALREAYQFLFTPPQAPPASPAISLYCHPIWVTDAQVDEDSMHQLQEFTLEGRMPGRLVGADVPAWLASSQRKLEISAEDIAEAEEFDPDTGRKRARALVLNALAEHAKQTLNEKDRDEGSSS